MMRGDPGQLTLCLRLIDWTVACGAWVSPPQPARHISSGLGPREGNAPRPWPRWRLTHTH